VGVARPAVTKCITLTHHQLHASCGQNEASVDQAVQILGVGIKPRAEMVALGVFIVFFCKGHKARG
jgi:hypothetical protein